MKVPKETVAHWGFFVPQSAQSLFSGRICSSRRIFFVGSMAAMASVVRAVGNAMKLVDGRKGKQCCWNDGQKDTSVVVVVCCERGNRCQLGANKDKFVKNKIKFRSGTCTPNLRILIAHHICSE